MQDPVFYLTIAATSLVGTIAVALIALKGWTGWLDLKKAEIGQHIPGADASPPSAAARIEVADLKERIRKLEAIAAGVEL
ncbi:MAG TPA: hypothetical protein VF509_03500 [Sphingobium sp.]